MPLPFRLSALFFLGGLALPVADATAAGIWDGTYTYAAHHGRTAGGSSIDADYRVRIAEGGTPSCTVEIEGFQTSEALLCSLHHDGSAVSLLFKSYASGDVVNPHGIAVYRPGQPLLRFERIERGGKVRLVTRWLGITGLDGQKPGADETFRPARSVGP